MFNIGPYEKNVKTNFSLNLISQLGPNIVGIVFSWSPFRILSDDPRPPTKTADISWHSFNIGPPYRENVWKSFSLKLLSQLEPKFVGVVLRRSPFRIVSGDHALPTKMAAISWHIVLTKGTLWEKCLKISLKLLGQMGSNFDWMILRWSPFRIVSADPPANQDGCHQPTKF